VHKEEMLEEIKRAEAEVRAAKEGAERERERILRDARREVLELQEQLRKEAEERADAILQAAEEGAGKEREAILAKGRTDAEALKAASSANVDKAVEAVLKEFQGAYDA